MISLLKLRLYQRRLRQMMAEIHDEYPDAEGDIAADIYTDIHETIRNVQTAESHLLAWINCRERNRRDPRLD